MAKVKGGSDAPDTKTVKGGSDAPAASHYEEWYCKVTQDGGIEKLKLVRPCVKITDEEAEVLNSGRKNSGQVIEGIAHVNMYFKAE